MYKFLSRYERLRRHFDDLSLCCVMYKETSPFLVAKRRTTKAIEFYGLLHSEHHQISLSQYLGGFKFFLTFNDSPQTRY